MADRELSEIEDHVRRGLALVLDVQPIRARAWQQRASRRGWLAALASRLAAWLQREERATAWAQVVTGRPGGALLWMATRPRRRTPLLLWVFVALTLLAVTLFTWQRLAPAEPATVASAPDVSVTLDDPRPAVGDAVSGSVLVRARHQATTGAIELRVFLLSARDEPQRLIATVPLSAGARRLATGETWRVPFTWLTQSGSAEPLGAGRYQLEASMTVSLEQRGATINAPASGRLIITLDPRQ
jgi:hypothetical protein